LDHIYQRLFEVIDRKGPQAYHLHLGKTIRTLHDIFQVFPLKLYKLNRRGTPMPPPSIEVESKYEYEVEAILDSKYMDSIMSYYVK
jgi:hypothetical protein